MSSFMNSYLKVSTPYTGSLFKFSPPLVINSGFTMFPIDFDIFEALSSTANPCTNNAL